MNEKRITETMKEYRVDRETAGFIIALQDGETQGDLEVVADNPVSARRKMGLDRSILDRPRVK